MRKLFAAACLMLACCRAPDPGRPALYRAYCVNEGKWLGSWDESRQEALRLRELHIVWHRHHQVRIHTY